MFWQFDLACVHQLIAPKMDRIWKLQRTRLGEGVPGVEISKQKE
jgi:hypothetical protein